MGVDKLILFLVTWVANSVIILILSVIFRQIIVLGNANIAGPMASVIVAFILTTLLYNIPSAVAKSDLKLKDDRLLIFVEAAVLCPFVWILKRFALYSGLGISNLFFNFFVLVLALSVSVVHFFTLKYASKLLAKI